MRVLLLDNHQSIYMKLFLRSTFLLFSLFSFSQIIGKVTDTKDNPLPFVNVYLENTYKGTTTNESGNYELNISQKESYVIVFQYLGFKTVKKTGCSN